MRSARGKCANGRVAAAARPLHDVRTMKAHHLPSISTDQLEAVLGGCGRRRCRPRGGGEDIEVSVQTGTAAQPAAGAQPAATASAGGAAAGAVNVIAV
jgi:hypothetical protein